MELYRDCSFEGLLTTGRISEAIQLRIETLEQAAHDTRIDLEASKFINGGTMLAGAVLAFSNPLIGLLASFGAGMYGYSLFKDYMNTRRLCPIPGVRLSLPEMFNRSKGGEDPMLMTLGYLSPQQAAEYEVLQVREVEFTKMLNDNRLRPEQRPAAYLFALRHAQQHPDTLELPPIELTAEAIVMPEWMALPAADMNPMAMIEPTDSTSADASAIDVSAKPVEPDLPYGRRFTTCPKCGSYGGFTERVDDKYCYHCSKCGWDWQFTPDGSPATEIQSPSQAAGVNLSVNPQIDVHNHIGRSEQQRRTASPAQSDRRTQAPDLSLYPDMRERMTVLLKAMAESGLPLGTLLNHPFVWCWGRSQSGKTTIALLLATARLAMGHQVSYYTTDDDYPRSLPWQRVEDTPEGYAVALDDAVETMSAAGKGKLKGQGWVFDELFAAAAQHKIEIQPLLTCVLMKGAKCGAGSIGISQADTSSAHGMKGIDTAWREERVSVQAIHEEDAIGNRHPTGRYIVNRGEDSQEWCIPEWMLTELNAEGSPDPMVWVLNRFPELSKPITTSPLKQSDRTEAIDTANAATDSSEPLEKLSRYLASKGKIDLRTLDKNWGRNNSFQGDALKELLTQLESRGSIVTWQDGIIWRG